MKISQKLILGNLGIASLSVIEYLTEDLPKIGMGLSISYQIITEKHGGSLQCISAPGQGAEFVIAIPIREAKSAQSSICDRT
ncbi:MAG: ATP-binding protein [Nostoc sp.]